MADSAGFPPRGQPSTLRERRRQQPPHLAKAAITAAAWQLPFEARGRYRLEFFAELHGMGRHDQVRYAGSLFLHSWSLAAALNEPSQVEMSGVKVRKDVRCLLTMHRYVRRYAHDADSMGGHVYLECTRCGKFRDIVKNPYGTFW